MRPMQIFRVAFLVFLALVSCSPPSAMAASGFTKLATVTARGDLTGVVVTPPREDGDQYVYMDYMYVGNTIDVLRVNKHTGGIKSYTNPVKSETGSYGITMGSDGNIYMGTLPHAHLYMVDVATQTLEDLGIPVPGEHYVWDLTSAPNGKIYGVTYPTCHLFSYDPRNHAMLDLGRMSPNNKYARFVVAGSDGYLYISVGSTHAGVVAYNLKTGHHRQLLPPDAQDKGFYKLVLAKDGAVRASGLGHNFHLGHNFQLHNGKALPISHNKPFTSANKRGVSTRFIKHLAYPGHPIKVFRFAVSPTGTLYGSTVLPLYFFSLDSDSATNKLTNLGKWGGGEAYSILWHQDRVLLANYFAKAPLMSFDPSKPVARRSDSYNKNPEYITFNGATDDWRPYAMSVAGDDIYVGAVAGYGHLGGSLSIWNPRTNEVVSYKNLITDQSIVSLAPSKDGKTVYGGTSVSGGGGTTPSQNSAVLFAFDTLTRKVTKTIVPVKGAKTIADLIVGPRGSHLFGFAGNTLFAMHIENGKIQILGKKDYGTLIYNGIYRGSNDRIYGLARKGVFKIDPYTGHSSLIGTAPTPITAGGGLRGHYIYYASGADIYRYDIGR